MNFPSNFFVPPPLKLPAYRPLPGTAWFRAQCGLGVFLFLTAKTTVLQQVLAPMTDRIGRPGAAYPGHLGLLLLAALTAGLMGFVLAMAGWINWMSWQSEKRRLVRQGGEAAVRIDRSPAPHPVVLARLSVTLAASAALLVLTIARAPVNAWTAGALAAAAVVAGMYACLVRDPAGRPGSPLDAAVGILFGLLVLALALWWSFQR